ncbi:MAG: hypothetical protein HZY79_03575 [Rhodoblastus sp.]|nr:MAG: hypothetical protein HZY79_03575 [Rhodoblastus sp.]
MRDAKFALALALALAGMLSAPSLALAAEENLGKEGVFTMIVVKDAAKFNRCVMHQGKGKDVLRIASNRGGAYSLSVPTVGQGKDASLSVAIDGAPGRRIPIAGQDKQRTWATLAPDVVDAVKAGRKTIDVELGQARFKWRLNGDMKGSFIVLDSCVEGYLNGA